MTRPLTVSLITVCYNSAKTIEQTLQSIHSQTYPHIEYIIIDGGSTDDTLEKIRQSKVRVDCLVSEQDNGIYDAMNKGIARSTGDIIGLLNADDLYAAPDVIAKVVNAFSEKEVDICYGDLVYFSPLTDQIIRYWKSTSFKKGLFAKGWNPPHPTFFVKRRCYEQAGDFDTSYSMGNDVELMMRFLEKAHFKSAHVPEVLVKMRLGGVSNASLKGVLTQNINVLKALKQLKISHSIFGFYYHKLFNRLGQFLLRPPKENACGK